MRPLLSVPMATLLVACGSAATPVVARHAPAAAPAPAPPRLPPGAGVQVVEPRTPSAGTLTLAAGFMPDPTVVHGRSGGDLDAATLGEGCVGWVDARNPNHLLVATTDYGRLRILATASQDITLVVQRPDGTFACNDDSENRDPIVELNAAAAGTYAVWVGSYQRGDSADYALGFTELATTTCASLRTSGPLPLPPPPPQG